MNAQEKFETIKQKLIREEEGVHDGKMMSAPGIKFNGKVFAFLAKSENMVFKLGKDLDPEEERLPLVPFNPFKKKGPLPGWFELDKKHMDHWEEFGYKSLKIIQS